MTTRSYRARVIALAAPLLLFGCGTRNVACSASYAQEPVISIVREQIEKLTSVKARDEDGGRSVAVSKIRAAVALLKISLDDIRTSKEDPNSTKRFCVATLKIAFAGTTLEDADAAREAAGLPTLSSMADDNDIERNADRFSVPIEFNVQPTDDGKKVYAETESGNNLFDFAGEALASGLLRSSIEDAQRTARVSEQQRAATLAAAELDSQSATLDMAKNESQLANQTINALWAAIPRASRTRLLNAQRAWSRKKDADCRIEGASASLVPAEIETRRLGCDARITQERIAYLEPYRGESPQAGPEVASTPEPEPADL